VHCAPIHILSFQPGDRTGLEAVNLVPIGSARHPFVLNISASCDLVGMFSSSQRPRSQWSGYMQSVCEGEHPAPSSVEMLAIIDLNPSDSNCIYSTLVSVLRKAEAQNIPTACITSDQPLC